MEPLFLKGVLQEKIWGGNKLATEFGYEIPSDKTGELWAISAHDNGPAIVKSGEFEGLTVKELWDQHRKLFDYQEGNVFPLLTKIIDASDNLSVQVHPDDEYGLANEGELGKTECWYIIDADPGSQIVFGHHASTKEEFVQLIEDENWDELLRYEDVKAGDFFYVPSGTIHAIGAGIMILETQQSSDTTYRVYDYDRTDDQGNPRDLHIAQSIDVSTIPHVDETPEPKTEENDGSLVTTLVDNSFFRVQEWQIEGQWDFKQDQHYTLVSILDGKGEMLIGEKSFPIKKGDHFILPAGIENWTVQGNIHAISSNPGKAL